MSLTRTLSCLVALLVCTSLAQDASMRAWAQVPSVAARQAQAPTGTARAPQVPTPPRPVSAVVTPQSAPPRPPLIGDGTDGSRARPVHRIPLRDIDGEVVRPTDQPVLPFSTVATCGADCHDVATIGRGWHFNTTDAGAAGLRRGEPWLLVDTETATQLPLSYHAWPGTFHPDAAGITPWMFAKLFGGRTPGGLTGARESNPGLQARWAVSGELEPNCLACHDGSPAYDHAEFGRQIGLENFRWAATAASGLGAVTGSAREMPSTFDHLMPVVEDALLPRVPSVAYSPDRFLPGAKVLVDIVREVPARRCYFCHSTVDIAQTGQGRWNADADVHLARGMTCVDCHRNGLDHAMTRGDDRDPARAGARAADVSCRGCHLASEPDRVFARGRAGAPYPRHAGLPPIHLQKLSCTACHSGPRPEPVTRGLKTSLAHRLGGQNVNKAADALPHISYPVFARQDDGTTTPNRIVWPAFWGLMETTTVTPLPLDRVKRVMGKAGVTLIRSADGSWPSLDLAIVTRILALLQADLKASGTPVYIAGGKLHRLDQAGSLAIEDHLSAQPYLWALAHDVRPAALALGARGCQDCHDANAPIFFGTVTVDSPLASERRGAWQMWRFQKNLDTTYVADFARSFRYRPWLKVSVSAAAAVLVLFVLAYVMPAMGRLSAATGAERWQRVVVNVIGVVSCAASVWSSWAALVSGQALTGYQMMIHVGSAPVFAAGAVLVTLFWAHRNRFGRADWNRVRRPFGAGSSRAATSYAVLLRKVCFWIAATATIPAVASATLAMFPILASVRQATLFEVHRYAVVVWLVSADGFILCALTAWLRRHPEDGGSAPQVVSGS